MNATWSRFRLFQAYWGELGKMRWCLCNTRPKTINQARNNAVFHCATGAVRASLYGTADKRWGLSDGAKSTWHRSRVTRSGAFKRYSKHKGMSHVEDPDHHCGIDRHVERRRCRRPAAQRATPARSSGWQSADRQVSGRQGPDRQVSAAGREQGLTATRIA